MDNKDYQRSKFDLQQGIAVVSIDHTRTLIYGPTKDPGPTDCFPIQEQTLPKTLPSGQEFTVLPIDLQSTTIGEPATIDSKKTTQASTAIQPTASQTPPPHYKHLVHLFLSDEPPTYFAATGIKVVPTKEVQNFEFF